MNDQGQRVSGNVRVVSISDGQPRLDLAIEPSATSAIDRPGGVESGSYDYEVVWESETGELFGMELLDVQTASLPGFQGAIQLNNLPATSAPKEIYRSDRTGDGERKLVGRLSAGRATTFVDTFADDARIGEPITSQVQKVDFATKVTVSLNNVGEIRPPQN